MRYGLKIVIHTSLLQLIFACQKEPAIEIDSNFIGDWKHNSTATNTVYLQIENDSKGYIEYFENGTFKSDTQRRKWLVKNGKLYFGWMSSKDEKFTIDQYPSIASNIIIHDNDTIGSGDYFMILDGEYFKK